MASELADNMDDGSRSLRRHRGRVSLSAIHLIGVGALLLIVLLALAY